MNLQPWSSLLCFAKVWGVCVVHALDSRWGFINRGLTPERTQIATAGCCYFTVKPSRDKQAYNMRSRACCCPCTGRVVKTHLATVATSQHFLQERQQNQASGLVSSSNSNQITILETRHEHRDDGDREPGNTQLVHL